MSHVYIVFEESANTFPFITHYVVDVFAHEKDAEAEAHKLNVENDDPVEEDGYGPLRGVKYIVQRVEVK